jgi:hypothetical protein
MDVGPVKKLKIGYWPLSYDLKAAGDRRRLVFWAKSRDHSIVTDRNQTVDVIVASENSDFNSPYFSKSNTPIILDLVDAYLSPLNSIDDSARGLAKWASNKITGRVKPFSHHIIDFCLNSNAVICSSVEQEAIIKSYNSNTHVILDSHEEIPFISRQVPKIFNSRHHRILWEGQPATIGGIKSIAPALKELSKTNSLSLDLVTDERYFQFLGKYLERETISILKRDLSDIINLLRIIPWTTNNLTACAEASSVAMIPIDLSVPMQRLKPENRLLIMWRLGLPCLTSPSPAYVRVSQKAGVNAVSNTLKEWTDNFDRLLKDPIFAYYEVLAGQNYLRENHNKTILLAKWDAAIESVLG